MAKRILIADDEQDILDILSKKLKAGGYEVTAVLNGEDVIKEFKIHSPDILLLDIAMPKVDGYTVAHTLREDKNYQHTPIIFTTAKELEYSGVQRRLEELGNCSFLSKPFVFEDLLGKIKELLK